MKRNRFFGMAMALVTACMCALPGQAQAPQYTETVVTLPSERFNGRIIKGFTVAADGTLDFYSAGDDRQAGGDPHYILRHDQSKDGGKTWNQVDDVEWAAQFGKADGENLDEVTADGEGNVYACAGEEIYRIQNGRPQKIASLGKRGNLNMGSVCGFTEGGEPVVGWADWENEKFAVTVLDGSGKVKKEHALTFLPGWYADGRIYGDDWKQTDAQSNQGCDIVSQPLEAADAPTRLTLDVALDKDPDTTTVGWGVLADGTLFYTSRNGLFRQLPGESGFTKVLNGDACLLGSGKIKYPTFWGQRAQSDGVLYMTALTAGGDIKLLRYAPAGSQ